MHETILNTCLPRLTGLFSCHHSGQYNIVVTDIVRLPVGDPTNTHTYTHSLTRVFCHVPPTKAKLHSTYSAPSLPIIAGHARMCLNRGRGWVGGVKAGHPLTFNPPTAPITVALRLDTPLLSLHKTAMKCGRHLPRLVAGGGGGGTN